MEKLVSLSLGFNIFNQSIISCLSFLPSLNTLDLGCSDEGTGLSTMSNLLHLNLDFNDFFSVDDVMRSMATTFPSLRFLSLYGCFVGGKLFANEVPDLPYLKVLILGQNNFNGTLPIEALASFQSSSRSRSGFNNFSGSIPSRINHLSSLNGSLTNDGKLPKQIKLLN
ncbi:hypothetical protein E3N88_22951 [Mikania micrantha]|uniref:Leucine-rich repeat-containing N-terminal plant-type domain-containing protein n=1 Tax=Mikania micrantha TaxID=192012 RepID=A0A5N6NDM6_9ASTR|nr:hypothetical protein E3N88_22951 [Mikania micrantha]